MSKEIREPLFAVWFGNFYRPAFDDRAFLDASMKVIARLGFNCVELDSKAWEDFRDRFAGGEASDYVAQQEYMMEAAGREADPWRIGDERGRNGWQVVQILVGKSQREPGNPCARAAFHLPGRPSHCEHRRRGTPAYLQYVGPCGSAQL